MNYLRLIETLLDAELFPLKDSYIPFLRHDRGAITRNPHTVNRIAGNLYQMGIDAVIERCTAPKETNIAKLNGKYVVGEAKFLTDFGGHQNAQFEDAISTQAQI